MSDETPIRLGFDRIAEDGAPVPNGMRPDLWRRRDSGDLENPVRGVAFRESFLPGFIARAGRKVICQSVDDAARSGDRWFYLLRPYGVPDLVGPLAGISDQVRQAIEVARCELVIDYSHEGYSRWMFTRLYDALRATCLPPNRVILLSGDAGVRKEHEHFVTARGLTRMARVYHVNWFRAQTAMVGNSLVERGELPTWESAASKSERRRFYLCFNRRNRLHRILTVTRLFHRGLLGDGLVSLEPAFEGRTNKGAFEDEAARFGLSGPLLRELHRDYPALEAVLPLHIDVAEMRTNHAHTYLGWPYEETWLSLVTESLFFESGPDQVFLSEKVFKPMLYFHPFIVIGDAGTLAALRGMGFHTFEPHIDESYDNEPDPLRRLEAALDELQRLAGMEPAQRRNWYFGLSGVLRHNRELLLTSGTADTLDRWAGAMDDEI